MNARKTGLVALFALFVLSAVMGPVMGQDSQSVPLTLNWSSPYAGWQRDLGELLSYLPSKDETRGIELDCDNSKDRKEYEIIQAGSGYWGVYEVQGWNFSSPYADEQKSLTQGGLLLVGDLSALGNWIQALACPEDTLTYEGAMIVLRPDQVLVIPKPKEEYHLSVGVKNLEDKQVISTINWTPEEGWSVVGYLGSYTQLPFDKDLAPDHRYAIVGLPQEVTSVFWDNDTLDYLLSEPASSRRLQEPNQPAYIIVTPS